MKACTWAGRAKGEARGGAIAKGEVRGGANSKARGGVKDRVRGGVKGGADCRVIIIIMLPWPMRLYFWGVHGVFIEVVFTSLWELLASSKKNLALHGFSSLWSFFMYGLGTFLLAEPAYRYAMRHHYPLPLRLLVYILVTYVWEFSCGLVLSRFGANSWDYSQFTYNIYGWITLEYAPFWALAGLVYEYIMHLMESVEELPQWKKRELTLTQ